MKRKLLGFIPLLDRYLLLNYLEFLFIVNLTFFVISILTLALYYFNISKTYSLSTLIKYSLYTSLGYYIFLFPITVIISFLLLENLLFKKRLIYVFFTNGINPKRLVFPFIWLGVFFTFSYLLFFEFLYPYSMLKSKEAYYESKKKVFNTGIAEDFWYKNGNSFLYFRILELKEKKAYGGFKFKVNSEFQIEEIVPIRESRFDLKPEKITFYYPDLKIYSFKGVREQKEQKEEINYDIKLLKVKKPEFITLSGLISILLKSQYLKLNLSAFIWELWKRLEFSIFVLVLTFLSALKVFNTWQKQKIFKNSLFLFAYSLAFYTGVFIYQTLVSKISLNPSYSLILLFVFLIPLMWEIKKGN
jgi:lipopolysaccharide export LptBFGC system permease protein LptF